MKIAVITDSGTGWNEHQAQERGLFYLPLQVKCGEEEFLDGINITVEELYERLRQGEMPSTSMPPVGRVEAMFAQLKEQGYEYVIAVPLSAGISSTASMIEAAAKRAELGITVIDPYTTVNTQGYLAECAYKLAQQDGFDPQSYELRLLDSEGGDSVEQLTKLLEENFEGCRIQRSTVCPVIAAHTGLGVVAIQYQKKVEGIE